MTPMEFARDEYNRAVGNNGEGHGAALEAACLAYLRALAEDEETVRTMAKAFEPEVRETVKGLRYETEWSRLCSKLRAALLALAKGK